MKAVDLFAGAGGLSLGLARAGFNVVLANEFSVDPEWTYRSNLLAGTFEAAFPVEPMDSSARSRQAHRAEVRAQILKERSGLGTDFSRRMRGGHVRDMLPDWWLAAWQETQGEIDLLVAGPPCQGFSSAGSRDTDDERNLLVGEALRVASCLMPKLVVIENVPGMLHRHRDVVAAVGQRLTALGYLVVVDLLHAERLGVPQTRKRLLIVGVRRDLVGSTAFHSKLREMVFPPGCPVESMPDSDALGPLLRRGNEYSASAILGDLEPEPPAYGSEKSWSTRYRPWSRLNELTRELRATRNVYLGGGIATGRGSTVTACANHESARHAPGIADRIRRLRDMAVRAPEHRCCSSWLRDALAAEDPSIRFTKKASQRVLLGDQWPMLTVTSLPDDIIHFEEDRVPTVREVARLQTFPDWYQFKGVRTTGAERRRAGIYVPQFTQVANAVPPRLAHALAARLRQFIARCERGHVDSLLDTGTYTSVNEGTLRHVVEELNTCFEAAASCARPIASSRPRRASTGGCTAPRT